MTTSLTYLMGEPGSGKTTVSRLLFEGMDSTVKTVPYVCWTEYHPRLCELGRDRETFGGTDALSMAAQKKVIRWLEEESKYQFVYAEGDRLTNGKFFTWALEHFDRVDLIALHNPKVVARRRKRRAKELDKAQNETWVAGRRTKLENLLEEFPVRVLDAAAPAEENASRILRGTLVGRAIERARSS